jgi:hypothetical protein
LSEEPGSTGSFDNAQLPAAPRVGGKTYLDAKNDEIIFLAGGRAVELNGVSGIAFAGQSIYFGEDGKSPRTECKYNQSGDHVTLACDVMGQSMVNARIVYTVGADGSLTGPPSGMWGEAQFSHLTEKK